MTGAKSAAPGSIITKSWVVARQASAITAVAVAGEFVEYMGNDNDVVCLPIGAGGDVLIEEVGRWELAIGIEHLGDCLQMDIAFDCRNRL
jgi:hypothetical protein